MMMVLLLFQMLVQELREIKVKVHTHNTFCLVLISVFYSLYFPRVLSWMLQQIFFHIPKLFHTNLEYKFIRKLIVYEKNRPVLGKIQYFEKLTLKRNLLKKKNKINLMKFVPNFSIIKHSCSSQSSEASTLLMIWVLKFFEFLGQRQLCSLINHVVGTTEYSLSPVPMN